MVLGFGISPARMMAALALVITGLLEMIYIQGALGVEKPLEGIWSRGLVIPGLDVDLGLSSHPHLMKYCLYTECRILCN